MDNRQPELRTQLDFVYAQVIEVALRHLFHPISDQFSKPTLEYLMGEVPRARYFLVRDALSMQRIWDKLRLVEPMVDFILDASAELRLRLDFSPVPFKKVCEGLAASVGQYRVDGSVVDATLQERLPREDDLTQLYAANPWFVTLILIQLSQAYKMPEQGRR